MQHRENSQVELDWLHRLLFGVSKVDERKAMFQNYEPPTAKLAEATLNLVKRLEEKKKVR